MVCTVIYPTLCMGTVHSIVVFHGHDGVRVDVKRDLNKKAPKDVGQMCFA